MKALGLDFIRRINITSGVVGLLALLFVSAYYNWQFGLGIFCGTAWGIANFHFLSELILAATAPGILNKKKIAVLGIVKFPVLYFGGYVLLKFTALPVLSFLVGFTLLFAVAVLKVLGRLLNEWLEKSRPPHNANSTVR